MNDFIDRFSFSKEGIDIINKNNEDIPFAINQECNVGDIVRLKNTNQVVEIIEKDLKIEDKFVSEYVGKLYAFDNKTKLLFNKEDIMEIIVSKKNNLDELKKHL